MVIDASKNPILSIQDLQLHWYFKIPVSFYWSSSQGRFNIRALWSGINVFKLLIS